MHYSMTMLCWVYYLGEDGPLFNYERSGHWGGQLFVRFFERDYSLIDEYLHNTRPVGGWKFVGTSYDGASGEAKL